MQALKAAGVLDEDAFPRDRHGEEEGVEPRVVEALSDVAAGGEDQALLAVGDRSE